MRGKPSDCWKTLPGLRITPAGAGKTRRVAHDALDDTDHPRRCGENDESAVLDAINTGSPPQVRGKHFNDGRLYEFRGITPAGAGKTAMGDNKRMTQRDHPRRCGENAVPQPVYIIKPGSPPQVRGKLSLKISRIMPTGITPAGAGKTPIWAICFSGDEDHPRRCGENALTKVRFAPSKGSPPQVRGKLGNPIV